MAVVYNRPIVLCVECNEASNVSCSLPEGQFARSLMAIDDDAIVGKPASGLVCIDLISPASILEERLKRDD